MTASARPQHIAIIGGGWAGLAAAVSLCQQHQVSLYEAAPQLGGRARAIHWNNHQLDNGQHLMIGAYQQMLQLLDLMAIDSQQLFKRIPHTMKMLDAQTADTLFSLNLPRLPAPLHLLFGVLRIPQLSWREKIQLLIHFNKLLNTPIETDINVSEWLEQAQLPTLYVDALLKPVCLAAMTTHPWQASAKAFQSVLQQTFNGPAAATDLLIPNTDLSAVLPDLAERYIIQNGGQVHTRHRLNSIQIDNNRVSSLTINESIHHFDQVILATPARVTSKLLRDSNLTQSVYDKISQLQYEPVATLYLQFNDLIALESPMFGVLNGYAEWVFSRAISGQPDILAVVISAHGDYLTQSAESLTQTILGELQRMIKDLPELIDSKLIIDKYATIRCHPEVDQYRPGIETNVRNLRLCGDYVYIEENNQPGLPSTLEGALRSGVKCAQLIQSSAD